MKILVPIKASNISIKALEKAIEISKIEKSILKIISFINEKELNRYKRNTQLWRQVDGSIISGKDIKICDEVIARKIERQIYLTLTELDISDVELEIEVMIGNPNKNLLKITQNEEINLIITTNEEFSYKSIFLQTQQLQNYFRF